MNIFYVMEFRTNNDIYLKIRQECMRHGFFVSKADPAESANLLYSMYNQIIASDAIIIDITSSSLNVWYELGLVHGAGKQFILVSKGVGSLPFNISTCHVIDVEIPGFVNEVVNMLRKIQSSTNYFSSDNPFLWSINNKPFIERLKYAHWAIHKAGSIAIEDSPCYLYIEVNGNVSCGLTNQMGTRIDYLAVGCNLNKWGWRGYDFFKLRKQGNGWFIRIKKYWFLRLFYGWLSNQFRFSIYARTANGECIYFDLDKWEVNDGFLREDGYGSKVLMVKV